MTFLAAQAVQTSVVAPEEFRRKVGLHHMCITDEVMQDTGYRELGLLYVDRGENLPDVALVRKNRPALFEKGLVTAARSEQDDEGSRLIASLKGEREGRPADLTMTLNRKKGDGLGVTLLLSQAGRGREYSCFPDIRKEQEQ
ncbi:MAG: hypothetical protein HEQ22_07860 [Sphingopyxis sp.]|uniref:hypothetical protein n=1 Tax=Sphingopyxis sp. TaxID=1908224 RepID=UPI003D80FEAD